MMKIKVLIFIIVFFILSGSIYSEKAKGIIYGNVSLTDGSKVSGVIITVDSDSKDSKVTFSTSKGFYKLSDLPPERYNIKFELEGFKTIIRKNVQVTENNSIPINIEMESIESGLGAATVEESGNTEKSIFSTGTIYSSEELKSIPTSRNIWELINKTPGLLVDPIIKDDRESEIGIAGFGNDPRSTSWSLDGNIIQNSFSPGSPSFGINLNQFEEIHITRGSENISSQTGGTHLNFVTKKGGNRISGDFHLYTSDDSWEMKQDPSEYMNENGLVVPGIQSLYQYGINLGGPIIKDKLWFFGSWAVQDIDKRTEVNLEDATWLVSGYGKLNFQLGNTSGHFQYTFDNKKKWGRTFLSPSQQDNGSLWDQEGPGYLYYGGLSHTFGQLMLNAKVIYTDGGFTLDPKGGDNEFKVVDDWSRVEGSAWNYATNRNSLNVSMDGNYFLEGTLGGDHEIRFGVDYYTADTTTTTLAPNNRIAYIYRDDPGHHGSGSNNYLKIIPDYTTDINFKRISAYIQDTITFGKLTASVGLRYDKETGSVNPFTSPAFTWYEPGSPHNGETLYPDTFTTDPVEGYSPDAAWSLISPRISMTYDITGDGKNVVKLSAARYMSQSGNNLANNYIPYRYGLAEWNDYNSDETPQYNELGDLFYDSGITIDPNTGLNRIKYDPDYNTPYLDELVLSFEKALSDDLAVSLTTFYKTNKNLTGKTGLMADGSIETVENYAQTGNQIVGGSSVPVFEQIEKPIGTYYYNKDDAYDRYLGLQFVMTKKLSNKWMANLSFTYQDWKRHRSENEEIDLNNYDFYDDTPYSPTLEGFNSRINGLKNTQFSIGDPLLNSRWMLKITGMYQLPWGLNLATFFQAREGNVATRYSPTRLNQGMVPLYGVDKKFGDERLPTFWMLNLGLEKTFKVTDTVTATLAIDWYNATNNQIELKHNSIIGEELDPDEPEPVMWTNAGLFQFGVRVNF